METNLMSDKTFKIMFCLMILALIVLAIKPSKIIVLGSANDNQGDINIDVKSRKAKKKTGNQKNISENV